MQPLVPLVFHKLPSPYPPSFRFLYLYTPGVLQTRLCKKHTFNAIALANSVYEHAGGKPTGGVVAWCMPQ